MKIFSSNDILEQAPTETKFLVAPILPLVGVSLLAGSPGSGKSTLVRGLALAAAKPDPTWLGLPLHQWAGSTGSKVMLIHLEEARSEVFRHLVELGLEGQHEVQVVDVDDVSDIAIRMDQVLEKQRPNLVIIDTMAELLSIREINSYTETVKALQEFRQLSEKYQTHFMFLHHTPKQATTDENAVLGSTGVRASVDSALILRKLPRTGTRVLSCSKIRVGREIESIAIGIDASRQSIKLGSAAEAQARENCVWFREIILSEGRALSKGDLA